MRHFIITAGAAIVAAIMPLGARAAVPNLMAPANASLPGDDLALNTEVTVRNWVLCLAQIYAEDLVRASDQGKSAAKDAIDRLEADRTCGRFPELRVILREPVIGSAPFATHRARAYAAQVSLEGRWIPAFVVDGGADAP